MDESSKAPSPEVGGEVEAGAEASSSHPGGAPRTGARTSRTPLLFLVEPLLELVSVGETLRALGYAVVDVALASLLARAQVQRPHVVLVDIDRDGVLEELGRLRRIPGGAGIDFVYLGSGSGPVKSTDEALGHDGSAYFARPVDVGALVRRLESLTGGPKSQESLEPAPLAALGANRFSSAPPPPPVLAPPSLPAPGLRAALPREPGPPLPMSSPSLSDLVEPKGGSFAPFGTVSNELQQLLADAEDQVDVKEHPRAEMPTPEEEIEAVLPAEVLALLDEPLGEDDDDDGELRGTGAGPGTGAGQPDTGAHARGTTGGGKLTTGSGMRRLGSDHPTREALTGRRPSELPLAPPLRVDDRGDSVSLVGPLDSRPLTIRDDLLEPVTREHGVPRSAPRPPDSVTISNDDLVVHRSSSPPGAGDPRLIVSPYEERRDPTVAHRRPSVPPSEEPRRSAQPASYDERRLYPPPSYVERRPAPGALDERRSSPVSHDDRRQAPASYDERRSPAASYDDRRQAPASYDERRSGPSHDDRRSPPPVRDERRPTVAPRSYEERRGASEARRLPSPPPARDELRQPARDELRPLREPSVTRDSAPPPSWVERTPARPPRSNAPPSWRPPASRAPGGAAAAAVVSLPAPLDARRWLAAAITERRSGALCFEHPDGGGGRVVRRLVLRDGDLVTAASGADAESLVCFLGARGELPREEADRLAGKVPPHGRHAGAALVAHGWLNQDQLWVVLRAHAEWIASGVLRLSDGTGQLEAEPPGRLRAEPSVFGAATGAEIFLELVRRAVAPDEAIDLCGGPGARLAPGPAHGLLPECQLPPVEAELLARAEGGALGDLLARANDDELAALVHGLALLGVVETIPAIEAPPPLSSASLVETQALDDEAIRARVRARLALVDEGDYFSVLGVRRDATSYEVRRAFLELRRAFEPARILGPRLLDLTDDVRKIVVVLEEAYEILRDGARRERYRRAIDAQPH